MNWTPFEIVSIILASSILAAAARGLFLIGEFKNRFTSLEVGTKDFREDVKNEFASVKADLKEIKTELRDIDKRLSHLEGAFEERGRKVYRIDAKEEPKEG